MKKYKYLDQCNKEDEDLLYANLFDGDLDAIEYVLEAYNNNQITLKDNELVINDEGYKKIGYDLDKEVLLWYKGKECIYDLIETYLMFYNIIEEMVYQESLVEQYNANIELD